jgi:hypothetical protein
MTRASTWFAVGTVALMALVAWIIWSLRPETWVAP